MKRKLSIDLETFSTVDIKVGVYRYVEQKEFKILLFAYAFDNEPVKCLDLDNGAKIPTEIIKAIKDANVIKTAWNALFEIVCLEKHLGIEIDVSQWQCSQIGARMVGLPASLDQAGYSLHLNTSKDKEGKALISLFCKPVKERKKKIGTISTETSKQTTLFADTPKRWSRATHPDKWESFIRYCTIDVQQERKIRDKISPMVEKAFTEEERFIWWVDHRINRRGVLADINFAKKCIDLADQRKAYCFKEAAKLTGLKNPRSNAQMKGWLENAIGEEIASLEKKHIPGIKEKALDELTEQVIDLRQELAKSSIAKFNSIIKSAGEDGRIKGLHKYFGAPKTGRWGSSGVQIHNLKKNDDDLDLELARRLVNNGDLDGLHMMFEEDPQEVISQLIRTAFIARPGYSLIMSDFSSIEARITAWLAGEKWKLDIFNTHGRVYEATAAQMFKVPLSSLYKANKDGSPIFDKDGNIIKGPNYSTMRPKAKISELALGFGGGWKALERMGGEAMGLSESEMRAIVKLWRKANPKIVEYWQEIEECALNAVQYGKEVKHKSGVSYKVENNILWLKLLSGRYIAYREPRIESKFVEALDTFKDTLTYMGMEQTRQKIVRLSTYGGKLVENIVQGIARDLLAGGLVQLNNAKFETVLHIHDEAVNEVPDNMIAQSVLKINKLMAIRPKWAETLPLAVESVVSKYYKK
ncbi:MAG TPA: DNA polymerase [Flavobacterium sp.]|nr:DNA polymerase [Flavobacterium sp.]